MRSSLIEVAQDNRKSPGSASFDLSFVFPGCARTTTALILQFYTVATIACFHILDNLLTIPRGFRPGEVIAHPLSNILVSKGARTPKSRVRLGRPQPGTGSNGAENEQMNPAKSNCAHRRAAWGRLSTIACGLLVSLLTACGNPAKAREGIAAGGGDIYERQCAACHGTEGHGMQAVGAPAIAGLSSRYVTEQINKFRGGHRGLDPKDIADMRMRPMAVGLSGEADIKAVSQYVARFLKRRHSSESTVEGNAERGLQIYATCASCHGFLGEGNEMVKAPALAGSDDWYLLTQLTNYRNGIRGADPADELGAQMRPYAEALKNDQAVKDVVAYIQSMPAYE